MAIVELFGKAEEAAASVKTTELAMQSAHIAHEANVEAAKKLFEETIAKSQRVVDEANKSYADAVNELQRLRVEIDTALGGVLGTNSNVRMF